MKVLFHLGQYYIFLFRVFARPKKHEIFLPQLMREIYSLGIMSIGIVCIISVFMGAVITMQTAYNLENPLIPKYLVGLTARDTMLLEFSSTIVGLILAGKVGSNIASEIGSMRITEQIDALDIMGINSANYLILPKITAAVLINPFLTVISMFVGIMGGALASILTEVVNISDYLYGIHYVFYPYYVFYSLIKSMFFAFIITSISAYQGYYITGGALQVGQASTRAVVYSSIMILLFNVLLTQLMLSK